MHVQVKAPEDKARDAPAVGTSFKLTGQDAEPAVADMQTSGPSDPAAQGSGVGTLADTATDAAGVPEPVQESAARSHTPVVRNEWDKTPRNAPCPCGSGKKFKLCHGR
ncbi:MAG: SEC-C metal-binding domain-containing protein [Acidimicrobiales bacterium]